MKVNDISKEMKRQKENLCPPTNVAMVSQSRHQGRGRK